MLAYHGKAEIKEFYINRVREHRIADEIKKGFYWKKEDDGVFRGCAVGCTLHSSDHVAYEKELGIPKVLAMLEDGIFENLSDKRSLIWPEEFLSAITPGADLLDVWPKFAVWLLTDEKYGVINFAKTNQQKNVIKKVYDFYKNHKNVSFLEWKDAVVIAAYVSEDAACAADATDDATAYAAAAADSAAYAAYAAADATAYAAAAYAAAADATAYAAADASIYTRKRIHIVQADKLLEILKETK